MNYDTYKMMLNHIQNLRSSLSGEPSANTLAAWRLEDTSHATLLDYYAQQDDDDAFTFDFSSEVKRK